MLVHFFISEFHDFYSIAEVIMMIIMMIIITTLHCSQSEIKFHFQFPSEYQISYLQAWFSAGPVELLCVPATLFFSTIDASACVCVCARVCVHVLGYSEIARSIFLSQMRIFPLPLSTSSIPCCFLFIPIFPFHHHIHTHIEAHRHTRKYMLHHILENNCIPRQNEQQTI